MFKIVSVGWECTDWLERTLFSVDSQTVRDYEVMVTYDRSGDNGASKIIDWCSAHDSRWNYTINPDQRFAVHNQYDAIKALGTEPDDIVVFLDLDGDQLAHPSVLDNLLTYYSDGTQLTYGSYRPVPYASTCPAVLPFPPEVVVRGAYREFIRNGGPCSFNHLRTMKGRIANAITPEQFVWDHGPHAGEWYNSGTDYCFILQGLELAGGRYKCIEEVLLLYNHANPRADYIEHPIDTNTCCLDFLSRPPRAPL